MAQIFFSELAPPAAVFAALPTYIDYWTWPRYLDVPVRPVLWDYAQRKTIPFEDPITDATLLEPFSKPKEANEQPVHSDAYHLRESFLDLHDRDELTAFLAICGPIKNVNPQHMIAPRAMSWHECMQWQAYFNRAMFIGSISSYDPLPQSLAEWPDGHDLMRFEWKFSDARAPGQQTQMKPGVAERKQVPAAFLEPLSVLDAIACTIALDIWNQVEFSSCLHCGRAFQLGGRTKRQFCSDRCKHTAGARRRRAAAKQNPPPRPVD